MNKDHSEYEYVRTFLQRGLAGCILIHSSIEMEKYDPKIIDLIRAVESCRLFLIDRQQKAGNIRRRFFIDQDS
jgi:hypothetical protein